MAISIERAALATMAIGLSFVGCVSSSGSSDKSTADASPSGDTIITTVDGGLGLLANLTNDSASSPVLVVRVLTPWCGPCQWHRAHTGDVLALDNLHRVRVVDVLLAGLDNGPPTAGDVADWADRNGTHVETIADPNFQLADIFPKRWILPLVAVVDARSRTPVAVFSDPAPDRLATAVHAALALVDGKSPPDAGASPALVDNRFTEEQWDLIAAMALPAKATRDPANAYESNPAAIALGKSLFADSALSPSPKQVSCASCHPSDLLFQDGKNQPPEGVGPVGRNVPTIVLAQEQRWQFWDGRADSAWAQATMPIEEPGEMASTRLFVAHVIAQKYGATYAAIFGALPPLEDSARFPASGKPGDSTWDTLAADDKVAVNRVFANVGKSIAAFEKSLRPIPNRLDHYASGDLTALTSQEKNGLSAFLAAGCVQCHHGPRLSDGSFHVLRFPTGMPDRSADPGRPGGITRLLTSDFLRSSIYSDAPTTFVPPSQGPSLLGAFKTPTLRGVGNTLPYGHGGSFGGLTSTIEAHRTGGLPPESPFAAGTTEPWPGGFDEGMIPLIENFLLAMTADLPP
jgi:cytochrome c peroxidase